MSADARRRGDPSAGIETRWILDLPGLAALEPAWRALEAEVPERAVTSDYDYLFPWYRHFSGVSGTPAVLTAWVGDRLAGGVPLVRWKGTLGRVPVRRLDCAGYPWDAGEMLAPDSSDEVVDALVRAWMGVPDLDVVGINGLKPGSPLLGSLERAASRAHAPTELDTYRYAVMDLRGGFGQYCARMSHNFRRALKRHRVRVEAAGGFRIHRVLEGSSPDEMGAGLDRMFAIADRSWKAVKLDPTVDRHRGFYREAAERFHRRGKAYLAILVIGGRDAAYLLGLIEKGRFFDITISFDDAFAALSPGTFLMQQTLEDLPGRGVHAVISHGDHPYKERVATGWESLHRVFCFRRTPHAALARWTRFYLPRLWPRQVAETARRAASSREPKRVA
jgi:CelD/BcsL family acetyltransferase involved in cellulose biosynthesis